MLIELSNVGYAYLAGTNFAVPALDDVNLTIADNEFIGIIGPTGSGKSTLAQLLNSLLRPTSGIVRMDGKDISTRAQADDLRRRVGLVFQFPESQLFGETVAADVSFGPRNLGLTESKVEERVHEALTEVGLDPTVYRARSPFELSGGEKRLIAIAGIVAMQPNVIILDEPTCGLDAKGRFTISNLLKKLHSQGLTVIVITHDLDEVIELANRVVVLYRGRVAMDDAVDSVFLNQARLLKTELEIPATMQLVAALRSCCMDIKGNPVTLDETVKAISESVRERNRS